MKVRGRVEAIRAIRSKFADVADPHKRNKLIKRAMQRGKIKLESLDEIFEFVSLNTAKKTLRALRQKSGRKGKRTYRDTMHNAAVADLPAGGKYRNTTHVARGQGDAIVAANPNSKPSRVRATDKPASFAIHEEAHLTDPLLKRYSTAVTNEQMRNAQKFQKLKPGQEDKLAKELIRRGEKVNRVNTKMEVRANKRALDMIKKSGGSAKDIKDYKNFAQAQMKYGYRNPIFADIMSRQKDQSLKTAKSVLRKNPYLRKVDLESLGEVFELGIKK